jgi:hypothetical protein
MATATDLIQKAKRKPQQRTIRFRGESLNLHFQPMSGAERFEWAKLAQKDLASAARLAIRVCVVDESGKPLFSERTVEELMSGDGALSQALADEAIRVSGLGEESVEEAMGNSEGSPTAS